MVELLEQLHNHSRYKHLTFDAPKMIELLSASSYAEDMICIVAIDRSEIVIGAIGGITMQPGFAKEKLAYKQFFVLDPEWRGYSQALQLLRALETWARSSGATMLNLFIDYNDQDNRVARLCERAGFLRQGIALTKELSK